MPKAQTLGEVVKTARLELGLSQNKLANLCGLDPCTIINIEHNRTKSQRFVLQILSKVLNLDLCALLELNNIKISHSNTIKIDNMSNLEKENLGTTIKIARLNNGLTQTELAELCNISRSKLSAIENNKRCSISHELLNIFSQVLQLDLNTLLNLELLQKKSMLALGVKIIHARQKCDFSSAELAKLCNISEQTLFFIETGYNNSISVSSLYSLCKHLKLDFCELLNLSGRKIESDSLGFEIMEARLEAGLSQTQLANLSGLSLMTICHIENGKIKKTSRKSIESLAKVLELELDALVALNNIKSAN